MCVGHCIPCVSFRQECTISLNSISLCVWAWRASNLWAICIVLKHWICPPVGYYPFPSWQSVWDRCHDYITSIFGHVVPWQKKVFIRGRGTLAPIQLFPTWNMSSCRPSLRVWAAFVSPPQVSCTGESWPEDCLGQGAPPGDFWLIARQPSASACAPHKRFPFWLPGVSWESHAAARALSEEDCEAPRFSGQARGVEILSVSFLKSNRLPEHVGHLASLHTLSLEYCLNLVELPVSVGNLSQLRSLLLNERWPLKRLLDGLAGLPHLSELDLEGCWELEWKEKGQFAILKQLHERGCKIALPNGRRNFPGEAVPGVMREWLATMAEASPMSCYRLRRRLYAASIHPRLGYSIPVINGGQLQLQIEGRQMSTLICSAVAALNCERPAL